jgi:hypothetical protein
VALGGHGAPAERFYAPPIGIQIRAYTTTKPPYSTSTHPMARSGRPRTARGRSSPSAEAEGDRPDPPVPGEHRGDDAAQAQQRRQSPQRDHATRAAPLGSSRPPPVPFSYRASYPSAGLYALPLGLALIALAFRAGGLKAGRGRRETSRRSAPPDPAANQDRRLHRRTTRIAPPLWPDLGETPLLRSGAWALFARVRRVSFVVRC